MSGHAQRLCTMGEFRDPGQTTAFVIPAFTSREVRMFTFSFVLYIVGCRLIIDLLIAVSWYRVWLLFLAIRSPPYFLSIILHQHKDGKSCVKSAYNEG